MQADEQFNDDTLKQAVCHAWADECCPGELHDKLQHVCGCASHRRWWAGHAFRAMAMAAIVMLVVVVWTRRAGGPGAAQPLPPTLVANLIKTHDYCSHLTDHQHLNAARNDDAAIARALGSQLHQAVLVARPTSPGWTFRGAAVCPVGNVPAGHLVFVNGGDTLSIFSLPASATPAAQARAAFDDADKDHHVVAFEKDGGLFCLVSTGSDEKANLAALMKMRDTMQNAVSTATNPVARTGDGDLIYAMR